MGGGNWLCGGKELDRSRSCAEHADAGGVGVAEVDLADLWAGAKAGFHDLDLLQSVDGDR